MKNDNDVDDYQEDDIYSSFKNKEEDNNQDLNNDSEESGYQEKKYKDNSLDEHTVVTRASKVSKMILYGFYLLIVLVGVIVFFMLRQDRYEFYLVKDTVNLTKGSSYQVELTPKNVRYFDYLNYKYEVGNEEVAKVDEFGTITAVGEGETTLKISLSPGFTSKKMKIKTENISIHSINLMVYKNNKLQNQNPISMNPNDSITLKAIGNNDENLNISVKYSSSNQSVAAVDEFGNVTAKAVGTATIYGEYNGVKGEVVINVKTKTKPGTTPSTPSTPSKPSSSTTVTKVEIGTNQVTKYVGDTISLSANTTPSNASVKSTKWESSNTKVATVTQSGVVKAVSKGTAVITVTIDGKKDTCTIIVKEKSSTPSQTAPSGTQVSAKEITLSKTTLTVNKGKTTTFDITVSGAVGMITVSSSNANIVKVTTSNSDCNGLSCFFDAQPGAKSTITYTVTGVATGTAYINVKLDDVITYDDKVLTGSGKIGILVK